MSGRVVSVSLSGSHSFSKMPVQSIRLLAGLGVEGDAHCGALVKHRYRVKQDPTQPNLCQVHFIGTELFEEVAAKGFVVKPGELGENITTTGVDLIGLPTGTVFKIGATAVVEITGCRNPCHQIDKFQNGLMTACREKAPDGTLIRKSGIMGIVVAGGDVRPGDRIEITLPPEPHKRLEPV
jgi:MOSC domain-containing protein YiiM